MAVTSVKVIQSETPCCDLTIYCTNRNSVVLGTDGSILWMFPGLAAQHVEVKQGIRANPPVGVSRRDTVLFKMMPLTETMFGLSAKRWRLGNLLAAEHEWQCS